MAAKPEWPWWKTTLWIYSIAYTAFLFLIFMIAGFSSSTSTSQQMNSSADQIAVLVLGVLFVPVVFFLATLRS